MGVGGSHSSEMVANRIRFSAPTQLPNGADMTAPSMRFAAVRRAGVSNRVGPEVPVSFEGWARTQCQPSFMVLLLSMCLRFGI